MSRQRLGASILLMAGLEISACGADRVAGHGTAASSRATATASASPSASGTATATAATPVTASTLAEALAFSWAAGYPPPAWLPARVTSAAPAPTGGAPSCGSDPSGQYTALIRYQAAASAAITIQLHGYAGPGTYTNTPSSMPVDVEVSPPQASETGLSGFDAAGATVSVDQGGKSGSVSSALLAGSRLAGSISGSWRCG